MEKEFSLSYLRQIVNWICLGRFYFLTLGVVIVTGLYLTRILKFIPDIVSLAFSMSGLFILLYQQITDAKQFAIHRPNTFSNWCRSFPTIKSITLKAETARFSSTGFKAHLSVSLPKNASIERKVQFLLTEVDNLQNFIVKIDDRIDDVANTLTNKSEERGSNIEILDKSLNSVIANHIIGDYDKNFFAIIITLCGTLIQFFYQQ